METFQEVPSTTSKVWVKAGTYDAGARSEYIFFSLSIENYLNIDITKCQFWTIINVNQTDTIFF